MAGPWFVDPQNGLTTNDGLSEATPWQLAPGQTGASAQTGYGVVAGDVINIRNGTTTTLRIVPPANNLTYRGYGLADNVLTLTLPANDITKTRTVRVAREWGIHEGMWTIDASGTDSDGAAINSSTRSGVVFEDVNMIGPQVGSRTSVTLASSVADVSGFTMRRFCITGGTGRGLTANTKNVLLELGRVSHTLDDSLALCAYPANGYRAGSVDTVRFLQLEEPNRQYVGAGDTGTSGDFLHLQPADGAWNGSLVAHDVYGYKSTDAKQGTVLHQTGVGASLKLYRWHVGGGGDIAMLLGHIKNLLTFTDSYFENWSLEALPLFRFDAADASPPAYAMDTGSRLRIANIVSVNPVTPAFYRSVYVSSYSFDGLIEIENNTVIGGNRPDSTLATIELWSASDLTTVGANFQLRLRNNVFLVAGKPQLKIPTGMGNDSRYQIAGNVFADGDYQIGSTAYSTIAAFQAAHSHATGNSEGDPLMAAGGRPMPGSPLLTQGADLGYIRDIRGFQSRKHIGAYGAARLRAV